MKVFALIQRLTRDLTQTNPSNLTAEERQTLQDCINAGLQTFHDHAPDHSKIIPISIYLAAPKTVSIAVTNGSVDFSGYTITSDEYYCSIIITGDGATNQIIGNGELLYPYIGTSGTVSATIYYDAAALSSEYSEIASNPRHLDTDVELTQGILSNRYGFRNFVIGSPDTYTLESNAYGELKSVLRVNRLPNQAIRLKSTAKMTPPRISFTDTTNANMVLPLRIEHVESYLMPYLRGLLAETSLWRDPATRQVAMKKGEQAELRYREMTPKTLSTPTNEVGTPAGF